MTDRPIRKLKKSETLEVRLPHPTKVAFMARCEADGASASEAVRGFIESYIQPKARPRGPGWKGGLRLVAGAVALAALTAVAAPSLAAAGLAFQFARADANHDAALSPAEFAAAVEVRPSVAPRGFSGRGVLAAQTHDLLAQIAFAAADTDRDGRVSPGEFRRAYSP